jgi:hypothetical protein
MDIFLIATIATILALLVPNWILLGMIIPVFIILGIKEIIPPLIPIGTSGFQVSDVFLLIAFLKTYALDRRTIQVHQIHMAAIIYLAILFITTTAAYVHLGEEIFSHELTALLRMGSLFSVILILSRSLHREKQIQWTIQLIDFLGYVCAASIFLDLFGILGASPVGEVAPVEGEAGGINRYFGILGDQAGYIFLFFIVYNILKRNYIGAMFFIIATISTGTRGVFLSLVLTIFITGIFLYNRSDSFERYWKISFFFFIVIFTFFSIDIGGIRSRVFETTESGSSYYQRKATVITALELFKEYPLIGVGFNGFAQMVGKVYGEGIYSEEYGHYSQRLSANASNQFLQVASDGGILALAGFLWMMMVFLRSLKRASVNVNDKQKIFFQAGFIWLIALLLSVQGACWLLPNSLISYLLFLILGLCVASLTSCHATKGTPIRLSAWFQRSRQTEILPIKL